MVRLRPHRQRDTGRGRTAPSARHSTFVLIGIVVALFYWVHTAVVDKLFFHESLTARLFPRNAHALFNRGEGVLMLLAFSVYAQVLSNKRWQVEATLREREATLATAQRIAHLGSWEWEIATNALRLSDEEYRLFGFTPGSAPPTLDTFMATIHPDDRQAVADALRASLAGTPYAATFRVVWPDGTIRVLQGQGEVARDAGGEPLRVIGTSLDITERTEAEAELRRAHAAAGAAYRAKADFLATMSHELRTPLNGVLGFAEVLHETPLTDEQREYVETISTSGTALLRIISDILDFATLEAGNLALETLDFDLAATVKEVTALLAAQARPKGVALACIIAPDVPTALRGDPVRLRQVLTNLVGNAVKFTERGEIVVRVRLAEETTETALVECMVSDTGIGMTEEETGRLFHSFSQADASSTRAYEGIGLGLVLSQRLIAMMGGTITVESERGRGTTVHFTARFHARADGAAERLEGTTRPGGLDYNGVLPRGE